MSARCTGGFSGFSRGSSLLAKSLQKIQNNQGW
jgi:hypothetical protein